MRHASRLLVLVCLLAFAAPAQAADTVTISGTAYEFNKVEVRLSGASIRVAEFPSLRATAKRDGSYKLRVPDRERVTIYAVKPGYHSVYTQTFTTDGEDLLRVNLQTPTDAVYSALASLMSVRLDANGDPQQCAIVSTLMTRDVRATSTFDEFTDYGAHGVAGATASASPSLPPAVYFNESVVPDRAQERSSKDGGVLWTEVPRGRYTIKASHPSKKFASFVATCVPGRVVNANPQWGLSELGRSQATSASASWSAGSMSVGLSKLRVTKLPAKASLTLRCSGPGCPFSSREVRTGGRKTVDVVKALGSKARRIGAGQTLELQADAATYNSSVVRWKLRAGKSPMGQRLCVPLGYLKPRPLSACES